MMARTAVLVVVAILNFASFASGGEDKQATSAPAALSPGAVAKVGDVEITSAQVDAGVKPVSRSIRKKDMPEMRQLVRQDLIRQELIRRYIKTHKVTCTPEDIKAKIAEYQDNASRAGIEYTPSDEDRLREDICHEKMNEDARSKEKVEAFIKDHAAYFDGTTVSIKYITFACDPTSSTEDQKAVKAGLEKLKKDLDSDKMTFDEAMKQSSPPPSKKNHGNTMSFQYVGVFSPFSLYPDESYPLVPTFAAAAFGTKVGQISDIVQTKFGFHLIKVLDRKDGSGKPLEIQNPLYYKDVARFCLLELLWTDVFLQGMHDCPIVIPKSSEVRRKN
jgi:hypothetical protein